MKNGFDWKRFWCPRGETFNLSDRGFLSDPEGKWGKYSNPDLVTFERLAEFPCAALLGEPGIGKSWTLQQEKVEVQISLANGAKLLSLDLRSYNTDSRLMDSLFNSEIFESWRKGDWILHVFLDSLDECLLRIDNVAALLADELPKQPVERLRLRIACRTAPWPTILEKALVNLFGDSHAYELVPLRRIDVKRAAQESGIADSDGFLARIDELDVSSLAIKPVTLKFLISTYLRDGDFPKDHLELYEKGCRILCEEVNDSRKGGGQRGRLNPDERLAIASRIAAVTQLCRRYAVYTGPEADGVPAEDVLINDLCGGSERSVDEVAVSTDALWEVLDTGLFSSRGVNRIGWAHQTYSEFLAARYHKRRKMPLEQIRPLLFHPSDQGRRLIPQLHEVSAWMAAMNPEVLKVVTSSDPEALLGAAAAGISDQQRRLVVESLLQQALEGRPLHLQWNLFGLYRKLKHSQLAAQLRPFLKDSKYPIGVAYVAVSMAWACQVEELGSDLAEIALDPLANPQLRNSAAASAAAVGSREVRATLRPLAFGKAGDDPTDELKGSGLKAIWPDSLTASELFSLLTPPKQPNMGTTYTSFLSDHVVAHLSVGDIPVALEWFAKQQHRQQLLGSVDRLMDGIVRFAWVNLHEPGVATGLATAIVSRIELYDHSILSSDDDREFAREMQHDQERRRTLLKSILPKLDLNGATAFLTDRMPLLAFSDLEWLIDRILSGEVKDSAPVEARIIRLAFDGKDQKLGAKLWSACQANSTLNAECGRFFGPIELDSEEATMLREDLRQQKEWKTPKPLVPPPAERIENNLRMIDAGGMIFWEQLTLDLNLGSASSRPAADLGPDLTETPGWKDADSSTRSRILGAAVRYLSEGDPRNSDWFRTSGIPYTAIAGYRALALLMVADPRFEALPKEVWAKWIPVLLRFGFGDKDELRMRDRLLRRAHELFPAETAKWILELIDGENERDGHLSAANEMDICWDDSLGAALLEKSRSRELKPQVLGSLLEFLLSRDFSGGRESAESHIESGLHGPNPEQSLAVVAGQVLLRCASDAGWTKIWPIIKENETIGREIVESASYGYSGGASFITKLNEADLGELYLWMVEAYPYVERKFGFGAVGPSDTAVMLRDGILENLKQRGSFAACDALRGVMAKLPQHPWLRLHLEEAEALARANSWRPISIAEFLALALDRDKRFVDSGSQLVETIVESFDRLHAKLHGELPAVRDLWNTPKEEFSPKDEQEVADYVARHLSEDLRGRGIIVNREVQIRRGIGDGTGQRTDIHVDAVMPGEPKRDVDRTYAIVEVKGNWNVELRSAMETQLRDRYLNENRCKEGVYLIAWFACPKWSDADSRRAKCPRVPLSEARESFSKQASELSRDGYFIRSYVLDSSLP